MSDGNGALPKLPKGWVWKTTGQLCDCIVPNRDKPKSFTGDIPWITLPDLGNGIYLDRSSSGIGLTKQEAVEYKARIIPKGSVIMSCIGRFGIVAVISADVVINQQLHAFVIPEGLAAAYLAYAIKTQTSYMEDIATSTTIAYLNKTNCNSVPIPVAPLAEQRRIVSKIESLQERSSRARRALSEVGPLLEQFRQSVLRAAFSGRMTADWRAANPDVEPATDLLSRIRTERRHRWEQSELAKYEAKGKQPPKNWQDKYSAESEIELTDDLPELPESWCYARADEIVEPDTIITYGIVQPGPHIEDGVPYIRGKDIEDGNILLDQLLRTSPDLHAKHSRSTVNEGDVLLCVIRHLKVALVPSGISDMNLTQGTVRLRPSEVIDAAYLANYLASPIGQGWMLRKHFGLAMPRINVADARAVPIPLAPLEEQAEVLRRVNEAMDVWENLRDSTVPLESALTQLDQSILAKAFRGELVPQDPRDEPASELLARIRTAREASGAQKKATRKRKARTK